MILLGHGSGGRLTHDLIENHFLPRFKNPVLSPLLDSAVLGDLALTTDAYVVSPIFFPGGDIGRLAVCGTVNDLWMVGAKPLGITAAFILEEGLPLSDVDRIADSMAAAAQEADVSIVTGDTKVVPKGACDRMFITTAGFGAMQPGFRPSPADVAPGDAIIVSGTIGDHGMAVMACREGLPLKGDLCSDVAPLGSLVTALVESNITVHALRDPTRGGLCQLLVEMAAAANARIVVEERNLPTKPTVRAACELLGIDPLFVANEGKLVAFVPEVAAQDALSLLRAHPRGKDAAIIGRVKAGNAGCEVTTMTGGTRSLRMASGELLPRIC